MADKLLILMTNTDPEQGQALAAVFAQATVAAAMEYEVEMVLTGISGRLAIRGYAESVRLGRDGQRSAYDLIRDAADNGVVFKVCTNTLESWGQDLIPEVRETVGAAYIISEAMDDATVTFTY